MATTPGGHLNPQGLTSVPLDNTVRNEEQARNDKMYAERFKQSEAARANANHYAKNDYVAPKKGIPGQIPGVPQSPLYSMQMPAAKKPGLFSRLHRAVSSRQFGRRK